MASSKSQHGALVVIGSGPGIGRNTASVFAEHGFTHIILASRSESKLADDASYMNSAHSHAKVRIQQIDVSADEAMLKSSLSGIDDKLKAAGVPLEVVLYNASRVAPSKILEFDAQEFATDQRINTTSLYITLQWAIPQLLSTSSASSSNDYNPAFLTTSGGLYNDPEHFLFSLSASKASQHNLMHSIHKKYEPQIHAACISVRGFVSDEAKVTTARAVGQEFWKLYQQPKGTEGKSTVDFEDPDYHRQVKEFGESLE